MAEAGEEILVDVSPGRLRAARVSGGELIELVHEPAKAVGAPGSIYLGRVVRRAPGLGAVFVDIGLDRPALLDTGDDAPKEGDVLPVQIIEAASGDKAARLTRRLALEGRFVVFLPGGKGVSVSRRVAVAKLRQRLQDVAAAAKKPGEGLIVRAAAAAAPDAVPLEIAALRAEWARIETAGATAAPPSCLRDDGDGLVRLLRRFLTEPLPRLVFNDALIAKRAATLAERLFGARPGIETELQRGALFERHGVAEALASAELPSVALKSGGRVAIETTAALTAIDVDLGQAVETGAEAALRTDLEAAAEIGRQLRLRALGGLIVVDFARLKDKAQRARVEAALRRAVAADPAGVQLLGWTAGGLFEMIRPRARAAAGAE